jgi:hypothetical protein
MSHFAEIDENNIVLRVLIVEQEFIDTGLLGDPARWIKTSYNTNSGVHLDGGVPLRKNFAGIGYNYDPVRDAFIPPKPFPSFVLNEETCQWESTVPRPDDVADEYWHWWSEDDMEWKKVVYLKYQYDENGNPVFDANGDPVIINNT